MFRLWLGLKAVALAHFCRLWLSKISGQAASSRPGPAGPGFGPSRAFAKFFSLASAGAFRLGFGLKGWQAGPKAVSGRHFGSALVQYQSQKAGALRPEAEAGTSLPVVASSKCLAVSF
ncbi:hypothetical protein B0H10DRAFT_1946679 [Mycena sp. CBHHK59/15]|nr:hypothetical protein B0H10DRAFT_1946679 [Mycena sp. CBHHK59/15]